VPAARIRERSLKSLTGTVDQIEWAERIREQVKGKFDRIAEGLKSAASKQSAGSSLENDHL
jgi:hypothetical protein